MTWGAVAVAGASLVGGMLQSDAASNASDAQTASAQAGIAEQQRQFDAIQKLLAPYANAGTNALGSYQNLLGANGQGAQQTEINGIQNGPAYQSMLKSATNSVLQNASATGGLRGGNTQGALEQISPTILAQLIQQQLSGYGNLVSIGQNAAAGTGSALSGTSNNTTSLLQQIGASQAGSSLASAGAYGNALSGVTGAFGQYLGGQTAAAPNAGFGTGGFNLSASPTSYGFDNSAFLASLGKP